MMTKNSASENNLALLENNSLINNWNRNSLYENGIVIFSEVTISTFSRDTDENVSILFNMIKFLKYLVNKFIVLSQK